jgi:hypothetical protein
MYGAYDYYSLGIVVTDRLLFTYLSFVKYTDQTQKQLTVANMADNDSKRIKLEIEKNKKELKRINLEKRKTVFGDIDAVLGKWQARLQSLPKNESGNYCLVIKPAADAPRSRLQCVYYASSYLSKDKPWTYSDYLLMYSGCVLNVTFRADTREQLLPLREDIRTLVVYGVKFSLIGPVDDRINNLAEEADHISNALKHNNRDQKIRDEYDEVARMARTWVLCDEEFDRVFENQDEDDKDYYELVNKSINDVVDNIVGTPSKSKAEDPLLSRFNEIVENFYKNWKAYYES